MAKVHRYVVDMSVCSAPIPTALLHQYEARCFTTADNGNNTFGTSIGAGGNKKNSTIKNLGTVAPVMIKEQDVQFCMQCGEEFSLIFNKKQSCYCCGKAGLKIKRVCNVCYEVLQENLTLVQKMFG
ncbi:hypothetical protein HELRODRAFT_167279 [Helobdella robusta]|uniref:FYVE zinc finger domain-containing protein n=1 Tax=Helobdella robusta TaxID=6412 RepID=T1EZ78_HELRO|nr:hypothetical protein HELRODRAFT_167279 [Helobdella robusta]ESO10780.1 hypothetical protein HELRODRAFT_167279 [Helobdella robusta]